MKQYVYSIVSENYDRTGEIYAKDVAEALKRVASFVSDRDFKNVKIEINEK